MDPAPDVSSPAAGHITLRYWAAARSAAGVDEDRIEVAGPVPLSDLLAAATRLHSSSTRFRDVLRTCSLMLGDRPVSSSDPEQVQVPPGSRVEFLPPFAGG